MVYSLVSMKDLVPCVLFERWGFTLLVFLLRWYGNPTFQPGEREREAGEGGAWFLMKLVRKGFMIGT